MNDENESKMTPYMDVPGFPPKEAIDLDALMAGEGDLELEIGFGRSRFILGRAANNPASRVLGIETRRKWVHRCNELAAKRGLSNVIARHGDAREILPRISVDASLSKVFINFPDPWWKAKHQKRMVISSEILSDVVRLLRPGGDLFVQTDVDFRADTYQEVLSNEPKLIPAAGDGRVEENPFNAMSSRERHCIELGLPIYRLHFIRSDN